MGSKSDFNDIVVKEEFTEFQLDDLKWKKENLEESQSIKCEKEAPVKPSEYPHAIKTFPCQSCGGIYKTLEALHKTTHLRKKITCKHCPKEFYSKYTLQNHIKSYHECEKCGTMFSCRAEVEFHLWQKHRETDSGESITPEKTKKLESPKKPEKLKKAKEITCKLCGKVFKHLCYLKKHQEDGCKNRKIFKCRHCSQEFTYDKSRKNHVRKKHSRKVVSQNVNAKEFRTFSCNFCQEDFKKKEQLDEHIQKEHVCVTIPCQEDNIPEEPIVKTEKPSEEPLFTIPPHLDVDDDVLECRICCRTYKNSTNLERHMRKYCKGSRESPRGKVYTCPICGWVCTVAREFLAHIRSHSTANQSAEMQPSEFQPSEVQPEFGNVVAWEEFSMEDTHSCPHCSETFNQEDLLEEHIEKKHKKLLIELGCVKKEVDN